MTAKSTCLLVAVALVLGMLAACGSGSQAATSPTARAQLPAPIRSSGKPRVNTCSVAQASIGRGDAGVRFSALCRGPERGALVGFSISRASFARILPHPTISGSGVFERYGSCERRGKEIVDCQARLSGKATIAGEVKVSPASRCSQVISITVVEPSKCSGNACPGDVPTRQLWNAVPRGC